MNLRVNILEAANNLKLVNNVQKPVAQDNLSANSGKVDTIGGVGKPVRMPKNNTAGLDFIA